MICERCGSEYEEDYRNYPRGKSRFCSRECSKKRVLTEETKKKLSERSKTLWKDPEYIKKMDERNGFFKSVSTKKRKEWAKKAGEKNSKRHQERIKKQIEEGRYEEMSSKIRREVLLKEANYTCESCKNSEWLGEEMWLEIHHIDGNKDNNKRENLIVLCPNCHSVIDKNYRFRGRSHK